MKLYRVENNFSRPLNRLLTYCIVIAENEDRAIEIAQKKFKKYYDDILSNDCKGEEDEYYTYDYYNKLQAIEVFSDLSKENSYFQAETHEENYK